MPGPSPTAQYHKKSKVTVNERVELILQGALHDSQLDSRGNKRDDRKLLRRRNELTALYDTSSEDKYLQKRLKAPAASPKKLPKDTMNPWSLPLSPIKCPAENSAMLLPAYGYVSPVKPRPWYNSNSKSPNNPAGNIDAHIKRYGAYSTSKLMASRTQDASAPNFDLKASASLSNLEVKVRPDVYTPPVLNTPCLWPEDSAYPTGVKLHSPMRRCPSPNFQFPSQAEGDGQIDYCLERVEAVQQKDIRALERKLDDEKRMRQQEIRQNRHKLKQWLANVKLEPVNHAIVYVKAKQGKSMTIIESTSYSPSSDYEAQCEMLQLHRFTLRWNSLATLINLMKKTPCRRPVLQEMEKLLIGAREMSTDEHDQHSMTRERFCELFTSKYSNFGRKHANQLYSSFDTCMSDRVDIRVVIGTIRMVRAQQDTTAHLLCQAWADYAVHDVVETAEHFKAPFLYCCGSDEEESELKTFADMLWHELSTAKVPSESELHSESDYPGTEQSDNNKVTIRSIRQALGRHIKIVDAISAQLNERKVDMFAKGEAQED